MQKMVKFWKWVERCGAGMVICLGRDADCVCVWK